VPHGDQLPLQRRGDGEEAGGGPHVEGPFIAAFDLTVVLVTSVRTRFDPRLASSGVEFDLYLTLD
jgi:hypothetical protein